jgi:hypothetical protein
MQAETARLQGLADYFAGKQTIPLEKPWIITAARYQALAEYYLAKTP